jgi:hypothetical protein
VTVVVRTRPQQLRRSIAKYDQYFGITAVDKHPAATAGGTSRAILRILAKHFASLRNLAKPARM